MQGAKRAVPEAKSHCGEGSRFAKATVKSAPAMRKPKASRVERKVCVCKGRGLAKSHRSRQKPHDGSATSGGGSEPSEF